MLSNPKCILICEIEPSHLCSSLSGVVDPYMGRGCVETKVGKYNEQLKPEQRGMKVQQSEAQSGLKSVKN